jgi:hypothetical protein
MIVGPLKSNIQFSVIIIILACLGIWIGSFSYKIDESSLINYKEHVFYDYFFGKNTSFIFSQITTLFAILIGAFFVNFLAIEQEITSKTNYLPAFFYILFAFSSPTRGVVEPILLANLFVLPALYFLINSYRQEYALSEIFKSAIFMGIASFFCIHYIVVFPLMYITIIILRPFNWREWIILLIGLTASLYVYVSFKYLTSSDAFVVFSMMKEAISSVQKPIVSEYYMGLIFVSTLSLFFALFHYLGKGFGGKVKTQKTKYILLWMTLFCLVMVFFEQMSDMILLPCIIPLSIIIGDYVSEIKQLKIANTLLTLFIAGFIVIYLHAVGAF